MKHIESAISPFHFMQAMEEHWTKELQNISSEALRESWLELGSAFGRQIAFHDTQNVDTKWQILQPPTGSGKTQGTIVYCALLAGLNPKIHPGVLIVTRLKSDADKIAKEVNRLTSQDNYAFSYHSDKSTGEALDHLNKYPVLVITHSAYERALDRLDNNAVERQTWPLFYEWQETSRMLVVIDEALDIVKESQVTLEGLRLTFAAIPQSIREKHPKDTKIIADVISMLEQKAESKNCKEAILSSPTIEKDGCKVLSGIRKALREIRFDHQLKRSDLNENASLLRQHDERLEALQRVLGSWIYYAKIPVHGHTLNSARLLVPENVKGVTVLDATASANVVYSLFDKAAILPPATGVRTYRNVTLHVSRGHSVGKVNLRKHAEELLTPLMEDLNTRLTGRDVFFATHKDIEAKVYAQKTTFNLKVGHWGAIDGSNEWMSCDTAVIFGLPYMPDTWTANTYFALQGVEDTEWLQTKKRAFGKHTDIRSALKVGQTVADVIQAINRIRCRRVIDAKGNCPETKIFLLLPDGALGDVILKDIINMMQGIQVKAWDLKGIPLKTKKKGRPKGNSNIQTALLSYLKSMKPGSLSKTKLREELQVSEKSMQRFIADAKDPATEVAKTLKSYGIVLKVDGLGRNARSYFYR